MGNENKSSRQSLTDILFKELRVPAWLMAVLALILLILGWIFPGKPPSGPATALSPTPISITTNPSERPDNAELCGESGTYNCTSSTGYEITVSGETLGEIQPYLLPISPEEETVLRELPKDGTGCVVSIAGNLVFYDGQDALVTEFETPVTLQYSFSTSDLQFQQIYNTQTSLPALESSLKEFAFGDQLTDCATQLRENEVDQIDLIPIYLYTPLNPEQSHIHIWKPFQNYKTEEDGEGNVTVTIEFLFWGDQQAGGGTKP